MTHRRRHVAVLQVDGLARVEGEGALHVEIVDGQLPPVQLRIYEPPRFFEALLRGRAYTEPPDITARICGICPVAYQMSACNAIESLCGVTVDGPLADLRRLLYCGEWIESHTLHIYLLHAPDFLGYEGAIEMADRSPRRWSSGASTSRRSATSSSPCRRSGRSTRSTSASAASTASRPKRSCGPSHPGSNGRGTSRSTRSAGSAGFDFPGFDHDGELVRSALAGRVPDHPRAARLDRRARHRPGRVRPPRRRGARRALQRRCTPACSDGATTSSARWPASPSTSTT